MFFYGPVPPAVVSVECCLTYRLAEPFMINIANWLLQRSLKTMKLLKHGAVSEKNIDIEDCSYK